MIFHHKLKGGVIMTQYKIVFMVDNRRTEQIVTAFNTNEAKKLIEAQYSGSRVVIHNVTPIYKK